MNYNFFAGKTDKLDVLEFLFKESDLRIYDSYSPYGQEVCEYKTLDEIASRLALDNGGQYASTFQLWSSRHKGEPIFRKIDLDPKRCQGHIFRYAINGWGLIQLYFGGMRNNELNYSHIGHFNEKGALKNENSTGFNGKVNAWDWAEIQNTSRKLKYHIHNRLAVRKIGSIGVLKGAEELEKQGFELI